MMKDVGDIIKEYRHIKVLTQHDMADALGVSSQLLSFVETGRAPLSRKLAKKIREIYPDMFLKISGTTTVDSDLKMMMVLRGMLTVSERKINDEKVKRENKRLYKLIEKSGRATDQEIKENLVKELI